jgi:hypothetical protein
MTPSIAKESIRRSTKNKMILRSPRRKLKKHNIYEKLKEFKGHN